MERLNKINLTFKERGKMDRIKNIFLVILKIILRSIYYACFALGAMYFVAVICFLNGISDFNFEIFSNANPEELKLMLKIMIQAFILLGILLTILEYFFKDFSKKPCSVTVHKLKPRGKTKEIKKI